MRRLLGIGAVLALLIVVMIAASGQGLARFDPPDFETAPVPMPTQESMPTQSATPMPPETQTDETAIAVVSAILSVIAVVAAGFVLFLIIRAILRAWAARIPRRQVDEAGAESFEAAADPDPEAAAPVIRRGIAAALRSIDEHVVPSDAIVAAWVGLEESASDAGITRGRSETPAEFTLRVITHRASVADDAHELLRLYERVRFAGLEAAEADRAEARRALASIQEGWR